MQEGWREGGPATRVPREKIKGEGRGAKGHTLEGTQLQGDKAGGVACRGFRQKMRWAVNARGRGEGGVKGGEGRKGDYHKGIQGEGEREASLQELALLLHTSTHPLQLGTSNATGRLIAQQNQQAQH